MAEARKASSIFPVGTSVLHENLDFLLHCDHGMIGVEVTELCLERPRAQAGRFAKVAGKAQARHRELPKSRVVDVAASFTPNVEDVGSRQLVTGLADFVLAHQNELGGFDWNDTDLSDGYSYIGIHEPLSPARRWWIAHGYSMTLAQKQQIDARIRAKNQRLAQYRAAVSEVWLVIINDRFLGAGMVYARLDRLADWQFVYEFDKVLLFLREAGGGGEVIELQRT